jgi:hypothetical protein
MNQTKVFKKGFLQKFDKSDESFLKWIFAPTQ